jgi:DNA-binding response OmpR family regulator
LSHLEAIVLRPICPTVILGKSVNTASLAAMLEAIGAPIIGMGTAAQVHQLIEARHPLLVVVDATSSLVELNVAITALSAMPPSMQPPTIAILVEHHLPALPYAPCLDDFILWPCNQPELEARVALVRWRRLGLTGAGVLRSGELSIDVRKHRVVVAGREVILTIREYELLRALVQARGAVLTRDKLLADVWGEDYLGGPRTVDIHIRRLRVKLPEIDDRIITVRGVGYRLAPPNEE